jgi:hypothetical protein
VHFNGTAATATWDSGTATGAATAVSLATTGYSGVVLTVQGDGAGASDGRATAQASFDGGTTWTDEASWPLADLLLYNDAIITELLFSLVAGSKTAYYIPSRGATNIRVMLTVAIVGSEEFALRAYPTTVPSEEFHTSDLIFNSLAVMDDWDESNRAKVNPIVGQAGVQGGAGASSATTQRVAIATDANVVQANAGTNLNTSALALEAGNLADIAGTVVELGESPTTHAILISGVDSGGLATVPIQVSPIGEVAVNIIGALPAGDFNIGNMDVATVPADPFGLNADAASASGSISAKLRQIATNGHPITGTVAVTQSGTWDEVGIHDSGNSITVDAPLGTPVNVQVGNGTLAAGVIDETGASAVDAMAIGGGTAHDAVNSGNPVQIGGHAVSGSATPTSVAAADRTRWIFNQHGIPYMMAGHPNLITREYDFGTAAQTDVNLAAAAVAGDERVYVTRFEALCDNANTVAVSVRAGFGTASVPAASSSGVSGMIASHPGIAAGSGIICGGVGGIIAVGGAGEEPRLTSTVATSGNLHVVISYYLIDETP